MRNQKWSYHISIDGNKGPELYNLEDPTEQENIIDEHWH